MLQSVIVACLVAGSAAYVLWTLLLPVAQRRRVAAWLLRSRPPEALARALRRQALVPPGCHCESCDRAPPSAPVPGAQPVRWLPRKRG